MKILYVKRKKVNIFMRQWVMVEGTTTGNLNIKIKDITYMTGKHF